MGNLIKISDGTQVKDLFGNAGTFIPDELARYDTYPLLRPVVTERGVKILAIANHFLVPIPGDRLLLVPKYSTTNFASVPFLFRLFISQTDPVFLIPAIVHDHLVWEWNPAFFEAALANDSLVDTYYQEPLVYSFAEGKILSREEAKIGWVEAAGIFKDLIHQYKGRTNRFKGNVGYFFLRLVGILRNRK